MIIECLKDIITFLILISYAGFAFSFIIMNVADDKDFVDGVTISFLVALGDWDNDRISFTEWVIFAFSSVLMLVVMMNLLISIVGDTFERVQMDSAIKDSEEVIELLLEIDIVLFRNRDKHDWRRIVVCQPYQASETASVNWEGRMRKFFDRIEVV